MEAVISIVGALASKAVEYTVGPAARQLSYLFKHRSKFLNLHSKVRDLEEARQRLKQSVEVATRNGEVIFDDVQRWLTEVNEKISEQAATQLLEDEEKATKRCFMGFCPDFRSRYHLSKKADREANAIAQLLTKKDAFNKVGHLPAVEVMDIIRPVKEYESFGSRNAAFDGVMAALEDDAVSIIGVYGMGGVGKTTLVKDVARQTKKKLSFDEVVFVAVTQTTNTISIQNEIANQLGLELGKDPSEHVRAARLCDRLKKAKKVLVILDDIWEKQDVDTLGIPSTDQHKGCKILMTSRKLVVLKSMNSQQNFTIDLLNEEEAWNLFKNVAGHFVERSDLQSTAKKVAQKCAGLPLAIKTVAIALKYKENLYEWHDALERLKPSENNFQGIQDEAYSAIELSYTCLKSEELKSTFLLCSVMGHDAAIQHLLKYCRGLRLFQGLDTIEKVRNRVLTLVSELQDSSLLLAGSTPERFDMHDVVCDVAISIASRDRGWLALRKEDVFEESSIEDTMRNSELVSLKYAKVSQLPDELECPKLTFFSTHGTVEVSHNFFQRMQALKVLEFASPGFTSIPSSIGSLKSLYALHLIDCDLENIVILGELRKLEILDLRRSRMRILPEKIGQITGLKILDLSECFYLEVISPNVLSNLSRLEELYLYGSFDKWEVEGSENPRSNVSLVELQHLSCLTTLEIHIPDAEAIPKGNLFWEKMKRFKISIGGRMWGSYGDEEMETSRMLKLKIKKSIHLVDRIKPLFRKIQSLHLDGMEDVGEMQMFYPPNVESFEHLKFIKVKNCNMLQNLFSSSIVKRLCQLEILEVSNCKNIIGLIVEKEEIDENDILEFNKLRILKLKELNRFNGLWYSENTLQSSVCLFDKKVILPVLEELEIEDMDNLERLWADHPFEHSFSKLTSISLDGCPKLLSVFPLSMLTRLRNLTKLKIWECESIEEIISKGGGNTNSSGMPSLSPQFIQLDVLSFEFPNLTSLNLAKLPKLKSIHRYKMHTISWPSLKNLFVWECNRVEILFANSQETSCQQPLFWANEVSCPALEVLHLNGCHKLKYAFTSSMVKSFVHLKTLEVYRCDEMEWVIEGTLAAEEGIINNIRVFPKLDSFELRWLLKLRNFCCAINPIEFPSLKSLKISRCHALNAFTFDVGKGRVTSSHYLIDEKVIFPVLEELEIKHMDNLERLWADHPVEHSFSKLTFIFLYDCPKLLSVFRLSMLTRLRNLTKLEIEECKSIEEIISEGGDNNSSSGMTSLSPQFIQLDVLSFEFPNLTSLELKELPKLKSIHRYKMHTISWPSLKKLFVWECNRVEILFANSQETSSQQPLFWVNEVIFPVLEELEIKYMDNLERLWADQLDEHTYSKLTSISLTGCPKLLNVFPLNMLTKLQRLTRLKIWTCESVEEIISEGGGNNSSSGIPSLSPQFIQLDVLSFEFPNLTSLFLYELPKLKSIHRYKMHTIIWPSLKLMKVSNCHAVEILFANSQETSSQEPLFWVNEVSFPALEELEVSDCPKVKYVFTSSMVKSFVHLKTLEVSECDEMEGVIEGTLAAEEGINSNIILFPKLDSLKLGKLLKLRNFCCAINPIELPSLKSLRILDCYALNTFTFDVGKSRVTSPHCMIDEKVKLPMLEKLSVDSINNLVRLWADQLVEHSSIPFGNLVSLYAFGCDGIIKLFTHSTAKSLVQLKEMRIWNCKEIEEIVQGGDDDDEISFPQINSLELVDLPKLESFCSSDKYTFGFPSLEVLLVDGCPKMKKFSEGHSNTPILHKVRITKWREAEHHWEGSLNSTIQKLFTEKCAIIERYKKLKEDQSKPSTSNAQRCENFEEDKSKPSTSNAQYDMIEGRENFEEDQIKSSTSNVQNLTKEVMKFIKDEDNSSTSNSQ